MWRWWLKWTIREWHHEQRLYVGTKSFWWSKEIAHQVMTPPLQCFQWNIIFLCFCLFSCSCLYLGDFFSIIHTTFSQLYTLESRVSPISLYLLWLKPHDHGYSLTCSHKTCDCTDYQELNVNQKYHILLFNLWVYAYINTFVVIVNAKIKYRTYVFIVYHMLEGVHRQCICATKWTKSVYSWMSTSNYYWVLVHWFTCLVLAYFFKSNHFPPHQSFHKRKCGLSIVVYKKHHN